MARHTTCEICAGIDASLSNVDNGRRLGVSEATIRRHREGHVENTSDATGESESHGPNGSSFVRFSQTAWGYDDYVAFIRERGMDPDNVTFTWGWTSNPQGGFWNKLNNVRALADTNEPEWPVVQRAEPVVVQIETPTSTPARAIPGARMSLKGADNQVGFRALPDGTFEPFHDDAAMDLFVEIARREQPDFIDILGDLIDLPSQSRWAQEAGFARTTQMSLDRTHAWLAALRAAAPRAVIRIVEGNHDKRLQTFVETNALAAFGLTRANMPESWPVMSLPWLLRLDELDIEYVDAYPAATTWDNDQTRNIHGTRANSKGSTTAQYVAELPHLNTWSGHTHRAEITYKTVLGPRGEAIESYSANPGCLCRTDGTVPSVHGAVGMDGQSASIVEDWQAGFGVNLFTETESWPFVYRIRDGKTIYNGELIGV